MPDESHLQDAAGHLEAGSAERQVKARFEASFNISIVNSESDVWQSGLPVAGPIRPSLLLSLRHRPWT